MSVFLTSVQSVLAIVLMISVGYFGKSKGWFNKQFSEALCKLIMQIALPASIFMAMQKYFHPEQLATLSAGVIFTAASIFIGYVLAFIAVHAFRVRPGRRGLMMTAINGANTVFIGMPLNIALFGEESLPYLLTYYIVNTIVIWTVGVWVTAADDPTLEHGSKAKFDWHHLIPTPLWGFIVALPFIYIPGLQAAFMKLTFATTALGDIGELVTPLSLMYIGIMLKDFGILKMEFDFNVIWTLLGRFVISPVVMALVILVGLNAGIRIDSVFQQTLIVQAATPALAVLPIIATMYHCDVKFATNIVVSTSVLFVIVVPVIMVLQNL
ncbi:Auxin Efflux Carrier [Coriobacterium glomerans PW2]|uniref:Auxin Efflux Carrier n=1 Tax=Coriobacterium glomerans (strain ATCC 49209 / DSM 20642 / JCM 10262 / PW2) TaxID=700015 RepID=F2NBF1_CORGP|nr:AEC family transporter [Coriobacterium glomerans]AEB06687.1 Auxin Efflux Carrier [Coriobacterium glomerans PW2]